MKKQKQIMLTCRDCRYGFTGLEWGIISCMKFKELFNPDAANYCGYYDSISKKEWTWRDILKRHSK